MKDFAAIPQEQKYKRHRHETILLYQLVERYYPELTTSLAEQGEYLPKYLSAILKSSCVVADLSADFYAWYSATVNMKS